MTVRHSRTGRPAARARRVTGAGIAGLTAAFAVAPLAHASGTPTPSGSAAATPDATAGHPGAASPHASAPQDDTTTPAPDFGTQKIRVGVQIKSGAYVPPGTTTGGTTVTIDETGPSASEAVSEEGTSCQTVVGTEQDGSTETVCQIDGAFNYLAFPGDTVTFTQSTVNAHLLKDPVPQTFGPCVQTPQEGYLTCSDDPIDIVFTDPGLPPVATDDSATTKIGQAVDIDVLNNDKTQGAPPQLALVSGPAHGTASVQSGTTPGARTSHNAAPSAGTPFFRYTPAAGFSGTDHFRYSLTTANGVARAVVTITIPAAPPPSVTPTSPPTSPSSPPLAVTGSSTTTLTDLGALLLITGGVATAAGRRRYRARHH